MKIFKPYVYLRINLRDTAPNEFYRAAIDLFGAFSIWDAILECKANNWSLTAFLRLWALGKCYDRNFAVGVYKHPSSSDIIEMRKHIFDEVRYEPINKWVRDSLKSGKMSLEQAGDLMVRTEEMCQQNLGSFLRTVFAACGY